MLTNPTKTLADYFRYFKEDVANYLAKNNELEKSLIVTWFMKIVEDDLWDSFEKRGRVTVVIDEDVDVPEGIFFEVDTLVNIWYADKTISESMDSIIKTHNHDTGSSN